MRVECFCTDCKHYSEGYCDEEVVTITNKEMTAAGFLPLCVDYEESEDD